MNEALDAFLTRNGLAAEGQSRQWTALTGGVSSDIWRVDLADGRSLCLKRALPKLKVAADWEAPVSRNAFEWAWMQFAAGVMPGSVPQPLAHDPQVGVFAMADLPATRFPLWKAQLLAGQVNVSTAAEVGDSLGRLHAASAHEPALAARFDTGASFYALRLEPYLLATARRHPALAPTLAALADRTAATRIALVHGDVSPKNILSGPQGPVFLDAECAWYGDPAFDLAFCLNHLLLKALVVPQAVDALASSFEVLVRAYFAQTARVAPRAALEARATLLLPALLLARVDGKSPVEYLRDDAQKQRVRQVAIPFLQAPARRLEDLAAAAYRQFTVAGS